MNRLRALWRTIGPTVTTVVVGVSLSVAGFVTTWYYETNVTKEAFERAATNRASAVEQGLDHGMSASESIAALFSAEQKVTPAQFHSFSTLLLDKIPEARPLAWIPRVDKDQRDAFVRRAQQYFPGFHITERNGEGNIVPAGERSIYFPILFLDPFSASMRGLDVASDPRWRATLEQAQRSGLKASTGRTHLFQRQRGLYGVLVFLPVFGLSTAASSQPRRLIGFAMAAVSIRDAVEDPLKLLKPAGIDFVVLDASAPRADQLLYHHVSRLRPRSPSGQNPADLMASDHGMRVTRTFTMAGRQWTVRLVSIPGYYGLSPNWQSWLVLGIGLGFTTALVGYLRLLRKRTDELVDYNQRLNVEITQRDAAQGALFDEKERAEVTLHAIGDAVITTDAEARVQYLNPAAESLTGWRISEARNQPVETVFNVVDEQSREPQANPVHACLKRNATAELPAPSLLLNRNGGEHPIEDAASLIHGRDGRIMGVVLTFHDVTEARRLAQYMAHQAAHDALTGLANRREFERRLEHALVSNREYGTDHALCYLDLDQFKIVNDTAGHAAGDELLKQVANLLAAGTRDRDTLARLGGDEFGLLLDNCPTDKAIEIASLLAATIREYRFSWEGRVFQIGVSIGLVPITEKSESTAQLMTQADVACYTAKDLGRNRVHVYELGDAEMARRHGEILRAAGLREALENNLFRLYFQPIVPLTPVGTQKTVHYELLLRLVDTDGEIVLPGAFIPAAERYGLMAAIDRWVIRTAFRRYAEVFARLPGTEISINLSGNSLSDETLVSFVVQQFAEFGVPPGRICFEVTETAAIRNLSHAARFIRAMKENGCHLALDDFGSGLSSFTYLKKLPVDYLKIDGSFVQEMVKDPIDYATVAAINQIGHTMDIQTVAEYVDSDGIIEKLKDLGVDYAQGFSFGFPRPLEELA